VATGGLGGGAGGARSLPWLLTLAFLARERDPLQVSAATIHPR
jgi:hypothetical protein